MVNVNASPNAGRRPSLSGRKPKAKVICPKCGELLTFYTSTACKRCYLVEHPTKEGECVACGRWMKLPYRGLCDRCTHVLPPGSGVDCRRRVKVVEKAEEVTACQQAFVEEIAPRVQRLAGRRLWRLPLHDRLELIAEAVALAWQTYVLERKRGYDSLGSPNLLAKRVVGRLLYGNRVTGTPNMEDVLCPRRKQFRPVKVVALVDKYHSLKPTSDAVAEEIDRREWLSRLASDDRRVVEFLAQGNNWEDVKSCFGMKAKQVGELIERLWKSSRMEKAAAE